MPTKLSVQIIENVHVGLNADVFVSVGSEIITQFLKMKPTSKELVVSVVLIDDKEMRKLNNQYRKLDQSTDVLSFSYFDEGALSDENNELGEIFISVDTAKVQAERYNHSLLTEIEVLFVHGLLHIIGFDHESKKDMKEMCAAEKKVLGSKSGLIDR